jgi:hypothetical protein
MQRFAKTFAQPRRPDKVGPTSNKFTFDLAGVPLTDDHLEAVRSEAVKAAMVAASDLLKVGNAFDDFGTFSTFSTFSTFGMSVGDQVLPVERPSAGKISKGVQRAIDETIGERP